LGKKDKVKEIVAKKGV